MSTNFNIDISNPDYAYLELDNEDLVNRKRPLTNMTKEQKHRFHLEIIRLMRRPEYFHWTVKTLLGVDLLPFQVVILQNLWNHSFPMFIMSRGGGKSFLLAIYSLLRNLLLPGNKIVIVGAAFRQSKVIFDYMDVIWKSNGASLYRSLCSDKSGPSRDVDRCTMKINDSWTIAVPLGTGDKIRGLRAHTIIADEFSSIPVEIYETVVSGFASVTSDPNSNVKMKAKVKKINNSVTSDKIDITHIKPPETNQNQSILSGTCGYDFEHFAAYWKRYKSIIKNRGDFIKVAKETGEGMIDSVGSEVPEYMKRLKYEQFAVVRIPYELIPEGFMDDQQVTRARATMHVGTYLREYAACFAKDSQGFFKRTLLEACTANHKNINQPNWPSYCEKPFHVTNRGHRDKSYVFGIDPASENDNFAIVVMEIHTEHQRVVHVWTTNKNDFQIRKKMGLTDANDYYSFCCRKIRELMRVFPCSRIGIDSQGGGYAIAEGLADKDKLYAGEQPIYEIIEDGKDKETDNLPGLHILQFIQFANAEWTSKHNHGLRKDMQDKLILFPAFDPVELAIASEQDAIKFEQLKREFGESQALRLYDTLEDTMMEVEDLKDEICTIIISVTPSGRERWDTPETKLDTGKKGRLRKDRYSALVIANALARESYREIAAPTYINVGRIVGSSYNTANTYNHSHVNKPDWIPSNARGVFKIVKRR